MNAINLDLLRAALLPVAAAAVSLSAQAQTGAGTDSQTTGAAKTNTAVAPAAAHRNYRAMRASQIIGKEVRNPEGTNIGRIRDLIVDMNTAEVRYTMLEFDPVILQGERVFAVPTTELRLGQDDQLVYNMTRDKLEQAAAPRADRATAWRDPKDLARLDRIWGVTQPSQTARAYRVTDLLGNDVSSPNGEGIGEVEDLVINMAARKVHYAVLAFDPSWTSPENNYAFPLRAFNLTDVEDKLVLDVDRSKIQAMKSFNDNRYANLNDAIWVVDVDRYLEEFTSGYTIEPNRTGAKKGASS